MSSKKTKAKISQSDLRKMMLQLKNKKTDQHQTNGCKEKTNNTSLKRKFIDQTVLNETAKISKSNTVSAAFNSTTSLKTNIKPCNTDSKLLKKEPVFKRSYDKISSASASNEKSSNSKYKKIQDRIESKKTTTSLVAGFYSDSDNSSDENDVSTIQPPKTNQTSINSQHVNNKNEKSLESSLPAGFFDDPKLDAKIRGVETPADKMDREWESFQRELQHESGQSEQLIEEEHETGHIDREIDEIDEQIHYYTLIDKLCDEKDALIQKVNNADTDSKKENQMKYDSSSDEIDEDLLDWREKDAFT